MWKSFIIMVFLSRSSPRHYLSPPTPPARRLSNDMINAQRSSRTLFFTCAARVSVYYDDHHYIIHLWLATTTTKNDLWLQGMGSHTRQINGPLCGDFACHPCTSLWLMWEGRSESFLFLVILNWDCGFLGIKKFFMVWRTRSDKIGNGIREEDREGDGMEQGQDRTRQERWV